MKKKLSFLPLLAAILAVLSTALIFGTNFTADGLGTTKRLGGKSRIETSLSICAEGWSSGSENVVIANGYSYPDAMAGVPLAAALDAPILLTKGELPEENLLMQLLALSAKNIYILGGEGSISQAFADTLSQSGYAVNRIYGVDRYDTSAAIAQKLFELGAASDTVFVASGNNFPDALSASPAAGILRSPIVYADRNGNISENALRLLSDSDIKQAVVLGGEAAVPYSAEEILKNCGIDNVVRLCGNDRYQTSLEINKHFNDIFTGADISLASGENFPDALSGGAFSAKNAIPLVLICNTRNIDGAYDYYCTRSGGTTYILGLEGAVSAYAAGTFLAGGTITTTAPPTTTTTTRPYNQGGKKAYLTFDDGPSANTMKILNILDKYNVKATFFVIYREGYENTYKEIVRRGHTLALHSYSHNYSKIYANKAAYFNDLEKLSNYLERITGVKSKIIRFPGGCSNTISRNYNKGIMTVLTKEVQARGYKYYDWNVDSCDAAENKVSAATIVANVKRGCGNMKSVNILMHDAPAKTTTVTALPEIIEYLLSKGYEILPITEDTPQVHHAVNN